MYVGAARLILVAVGGGLTARALADGSAPPALRDAGGNCARRRSRRRRERSRPRDADAQRKKTRTAPARAPTPRRAAVDGGDVTRTRATRRADAVPTPAAPLARRATRNTTGRPPIAATATGASTTRRERAPGALHNAPPAAPTTRVQQRAARATHARRRRALSLSWRSPFSQNARVGDAALCRRRVRAGRHRDDDDRRPAGRRQHAQHRRHIRRI